MDNEERTSLPLCSVKIWYISEGHSLASCGQNDPVCGHGFLGGLAKLLLNWSRDQSSEGQLSLRKLMAESARRIQASTTGDLSVEEWLH